MNRTLFEFTFINNILPPELWNIIFSYLGVGDLIAIAKSCKQLYSYSNYQTVIKINQNYHRDWSLALGLECKQSICDFSERHKVIYKLQYFNNQAISDITRLGHSCTDITTSKALLTKVQKLQHLAKTYRITRIPDSHDEFTIDGPLYDFLYSGKGMNYAISFYPSQTGILEISELNPAIDQNLEVIDAYLIRKYEERFYGRTSCEKVLINTKLRVKSIIFYR